MCLQTFLNYIFQLPNLLENRKMSDNNKSQVCALIMDPSTYNPDTLDLNSDLEAREYWLECFANMIKKFSAQAARSEKDDPTAANRAQQ